MTICKVIEKKESGRWRREWMRRGEERSGGKAKVEKNSTRVRRKE